MQVVAVVGCVAREGESWILRNASPPLVQPRTDGKVKSGSAVTVQMAKAQPPGKERYQLMGMVDDFGVPTHAGDRVLVRGLLLGDAALRRLNLVSFTRVERGCDAK
jgi:hypothetical protein